jgi:tetratricopeptide (TPR) repeat protein
MLPPSQKQDERLPLMPSPSSKSQSRLLLLGGVSVTLAVATLMIYWQTIRFDFTTWDDTEYVTENEQVCAGLTISGIKWAFTSFKAANWHPLTWISHMVDVQLFGLNPKGHHLMNVVFHIVNGILLFLLLTRMTGYLWRCAFIAALFSIHPLHVESVAWVAERKDVLSTVFWLLTMWAYIEYAINKSRLRYGLVILFFVLGLLAKPMLVTLPFVLLLLDYWPLSRLITKKQGRRAVIRWEIVREKIPLIALAVVSSVITFIAQATGGAVRPTDTIPVESRLGNALISYVAYLGKMCWPERLAAYYPYNLNELSGLLAVGALAVLIFVSALAYRSRHSYPYLIVGWLWYLGTLVPVIGLVQVGSQAMADRYTYVPLIGIFWAISFLVADLAAGSIPIRGQRERRGDLPAWRRTLLIGCALLAICALGIRSYFQAGYWINTKILFERTLQITQNNFAAHHVLGMYYFKANLVDEAIQQLESAIRISRVFPETFNALGTLYINKGRVSEAVGAFEKAARLQPGAFWHHRNLANAYLQQDKIEEAIRELRLYAQLLPQSSDPHKMLGSVFMQSNQLTEAAREYQKAVELDPNDPTTHQALGLIYDKQGRLEDAARELEWVLKIHPDDFDGHNNLGYVYGKMGRLDEAVRELQAAIKILPEHPEPHNNLGEVRRRQKRFQEAERELQFALDKNPNHVEARTNLGKVYLDQQRVMDAIREFRFALKINPGDADAQENLKIALARQGGGKR